MSFEEIERKYNRKKAKYEEHVKLYENIDSWRSPLKNFSGVVFLTFSRPNECQRYYKSFPHSIWKKIGNHLRLFFGRWFPKCKLDYKGKSFNFFNKILVEKAPDPEDVLWQNLGLDSGSRHRRVFSIYAYSILLTSVNFGVIISLDYVQVQNVKQTNFAASYAISFAISIVITIVNFILNTIMHYLSDFEKCRYYTELYLSISIKLTLLTFLNSAIIPYLSNLINRRGDFQNFLTNIVIIFLSQAFLTPTLYFLDIYYYYKVFSRKFFYRKVRENERKKIQPVHDKSQKELNELFENPPMYIQHKYSYICNTVLICFFYIAIFPLGVLFGILGLLYLYAVEKHLVIHRYKRSENLNQEIYMFYIKYFKVSLFIFALGIFISLPKLAESDKALSILQLILWGVIMFIPVSHFLKINYIKTKQDFLNDILYEDAKKTKFFFNYKNINPAYIIQSEKGIKSFTKNHQQLVYDQRILKNLSKNILHKQLTSFYPPEITEEKGENKNKEEEVKGNKKENKAENELKVPERLAASHPLPEQKNVDFGLLDIENQKLFEKFKSMVFIPTDSENKLRNQMNPIDDKKENKIKAELELLNEEETELNIHNKTDPEINLKVLDLDKSVDDQKFNSIHSVNLITKVNKEKNYLNEINKEDKNNGNLFEESSKKKNKVLFAINPGLVKNTDFTEANKILRDSRPIKYSHELDKDEIEFVDDDNEINFKQINKEYSPDKGKRAGEPSSVKSDLAQIIGNHIGSSYNKDKNT